MVSDAEDEEFLMSWNDFNKNLVAEFHELICRVDLVDVTLAAEGRLLKAHRLILSASSPYFRQMFTQMPHNQHAFVFLKDVPYVTLKDLVQYMYCGEVRVKRETLPVLLSVAEALQIKGLSGGVEDVSTMPNAQSTQGADNDIVSTSVNAFTSKSITQPPPNTQSTQRADNDIDISTSVNAITSKSITSTSQKRISHNQSNVPQKAPKRSKIASTINSSDRIEPLQLPERQSEPDQNQELQAQPHQQHSIQEIRVVQMAPNEAICAIRIDPTPGDDRSMKTESGNGDNIEESFATVNNDTDGASSSVSVTQISNEGTEPIINFEKTKLGNTVVTINGHKMYKSYSTNQLTHYRCRLYRDLGCNARCNVRKKDDGIDEVEVDHNHGLHTQTLIGNQQLKQAKYQPLVVIKQENYYD